MTYIVKNGTDKLLSAKILSQKLSIPYKYLTQIMTQLVNANIIKSIRGREGGFCLAKEPIMIKLIDILEAVKECLDDSNCVLGVGLCNENKKCALHDKWKTPKKSLLNMFQNTTLADISK